MPACFNHDECSLQLILGVEGQDPGQFLMHRCDFGQQHSKENDARTEIADEHQPAEVFVSRDEDPVPPVRNVEQFQITCLGVTQISSRHYIMPQIEEKTRCDGVDVLIQEQIHAATAM